MNYVLQVFAEHSARKLQMLNANSDLQKKISGQILNRNIKWEKSVGISNLFQGGIHNHLISYQSYARPLLENNFFTHMMTKDDLFEITNVIFERFNFSPNYSPLSLFEFLLKYYDNTIQVTSWNALVEFLER